MAKPPEAPMSSTATVWHPGQSLDITEFRVVMIHLVSYMKKMVGLSCLILFFIIRCFEGFLSPRIFQDMSFIIDNYEG